MDGGLFLVCVMIALTVLNMGCVFACVKESLNKESVERSLKEVNARIAHETERLQGQYDAIYKETFLDSIIARIQRKQLNLRCGGKSS